MKKGSFEVVFDSDAANELGISKIQILELFKKCIIPSLDRYKGMEPVKACYRKDLDKYKAGNK